MADLAVVANSVAGATGAVYKPAQPPLIAGEALTAGQVVYQKTSDNKIYKAKANTSTAPISPATWPPETVPVGIAMNGAAIGQPVFLLTGGGVVLGVAVVPGMIYCLSAANAGGIAPFADLAAAQTPPQYVTIVGWGAADAVTLNLNLLPTNVAR